LKKALALSALPLALLFGAAFQLSIPDQLKAIQSGISDLEAQVASLANKGPRKFYLTKTFHNGAGALSACAAGYHMASLWEIHEPAILRYNTELGFTLADSGFGPPVHIPGWIRTGAESNIVFSTSCITWTSASQMDAGTVAALVEYGSIPDPATAISPWRAQGLLCHIAVEVWCVQD